MVRRELPALAVLLACVACGRSERTEVTTRDAALLEPITDRALVQSLGPTAERILEAHRDAPLGTEIPFEHEGQRFVARIELHDNPAADPGRPAGSHRGVSVYRAR